MTRALAAVCALCVVLSACGHYGPPVHPVGREEPKAKPEADPAASDTNPAHQERDHHEP
jgi:hypothetical protein